MEFTPDELAGIVGLFGALTSEELMTACQELAYRQTGQSVANATLQATIEDAETSYILVNTEIDGRESYVVGPAAFPEIPEGGRDLPHMLDLSHCTVNRQEIAEELLERFLGQEIDIERESAIELSYDLESWTNIDASDLREHVESLP